MPVMMNCKKLSRHKTGAGKKVFIPSTNFKRYSTSIFRVGATVSILLDAKILLRLENCSMPAMSADASVQIIYEAWNSLSDSRHKITFETVLPLYAWKKCIDHPHKLGLLLPFQSRTLTM